MVERKGCSFMRLKATLGDSFVSFCGFFYVGHEGGGPLVHMGADTI